MKIGVIADDFTGASDIALTLAEAGMSTVQYNGIPKGVGVMSPEAAVVALKSRTAPVAEAVAQSVAACDWLRAQGAEQIVFKVCSTFDSTAEGNIGPVLDALSTRLQAEGVIVCPAFPENGRSVYQGHLFVGDRLLNESGMQDHPLTPMRDADLRRVLAEQTTRPVGHVPMTMVAAGEVAIKDALPTRGYAIVDAISDDDLLSIGRAARGAALVCGGSGIALGLPENFGATAFTPPWEPVTGPGVVLSGSCSRATRRQVKLYQEAAPTREISAEDILEGRTSVEQLCDWVLSQALPPMVFSSADPQSVAEVQERLGRERTAQVLEGAFAELAAMLRQEGVRRIVVAGGETSGAVVQGLGAMELEIGPRLAPGVPMVRMVGAEPVALTLKSGNFGAPTFFATALAHMEGLYD
ncbi:3-oxo-tetronate kinase [Tritonibacter mobilis]|uniref:3-oxo-tetronate kinase n=1 Tax=Tritonibacter mobilis TaxID=379347 RepID=UPI003A5C2E0F